MAAPSPYVRTLGPRFPRHRLRAHNRESLTRARMELRARGLNTKYLSPRTNLAFRRGITSVDMQEQVIVDLEALRVPRARAVRIADLLWVHDDTRGWRQEENADWLLMNDEGLNRPSREDVERTTTFRKGMPRVEVVDSEASDDQGRQAAAGGGGARQQEEFYQAPNDWVPDR